MEPKELTLLDLLTHLRRRGHGILWLALGAGVLVYGASLLLPPRYESRALARLDLQPPPSVEASTGQAQTHLASLVGALQVAGMEWRFPDGERVGRLARLEWKDGDQTLSFRVAGSTPKAAQERAAWLLGESERYLREKIWEVYRSLAQAELAKAKENLEALRKGLGATPPKALSAGGSALAPYLEAQGVSPPVARAQDPAATYLALRRAELWAQMAQIQAEADRLERLVREDGALGRFLAVSVLVPPTLPEKPLSPRPLAYGVLAALGAFLLGLLWVLLAATLGEETPSRPLRGGGGGPEEGG
ncbi:lipopolysaccharide biosynthesis protein [Thermus sp.]|uniref:lipopolysaccharide biosynthesis protein n=1 Tax=Thermus sp. TaxID=275 RepID=UPI003D12ACD0